MICKPGILVDSSVNEASMKQCVNDVQSCDIIYSKKNISAIQYMTVK